MVATPKSPFQTRFLFGSSSRRDSGCDNGDFPMCWEGEKGDDEEGLWA